MNSFRIENMYGIAEATIRTVFLESYLLLEFSSLFTVFGIKKYSYMFDRVFKNASFHPDNGLRKRKKMKRV